MISIKFLTLVPSNFLSQSTSMLASKKKACSSSIPCFPTSRSYQRNWSSSCREMSSSYMEQTDQSPGFHLYTVALSGRTLQSKSSNKCQNLLALKSDSIVEEYARQKGLATSYVGLLHPCTSDLVRQFSEVSSKANEAELLFISEYNARLHTSPNNRNNQTPPLVTYSVLVERLCKFAHSSALVVVSSNTTKSLSIVKKCTRGTSCCKCLSRR